MSRQSIVAPIGLITQPNKYGQYKRGALSVATNVVMRAPGVISSMPDVRTLRASTATTTNRVIRALFAANTNMIQYAENAAVSATEISWAQISSVVSVTYPTNWEGGAIAACARHASARDRYFFTCWSPTLTAAKFRGVLAFDSEASATARPAGLSPLAFLFPSIGFVTDAGAIPANSQAAWRAVIHRTSQTDGYDLVSAPTSACSGYTNATTLDPRIDVYFPMQHNYQPGDVCEVYRTATAVGTDTEPGDVMELAVSQIITSTDITNGLISLRDTCPDIGLGAALYTNEGQEGATAANFDPAECADMCTFKGHMFYVAHTTPAQAKASPRTAHGLLGTDHERLYGIGRRVTTGTYTSGSPTITAVNNMRGIVVGCTVRDPKFPGGIANVISVTSTTITVNKNATASSAGASVTSDDQLYIAIPGLLSETGDLTGSESWAAGVAAGLGGSPLIWSQTVNFRADMDVGTIILKAVYGMDRVLIMPRVFGSSFTLRATNGVNYSPPLPEWLSTANVYAPETKFNRYAWSKFQKPEAVPPLNYGFVGSGKLLRIIPTRDALWMFCTDGMYRLTGFGGDGNTWRVDLADPNLILAARNAVCTMKETIWCYCNRGLVAISDDGGIQEISLGVIGEIIPGAAFSDTWDTWMASDEAHQEVWLTFRSGTLGAGSSTTYIFNALTKTFVKMSNAKEYSIGAYAPFLRSLVLGEVVAGSPSGNPNLKYFEDDTSNNRMSGPDVRYQPLYVSDPFDLKQFQSVTMVFESMNAAATMTPLFSDTAFTSFAVNQSAGESRCTVGVPRNAPAVASLLTPGFQMSNVAAPWSFRGLSARFSPGGETTERD